MFSGKPIADFPGVFPKNSKNKRTKLNDILKSTVLKTDFT